MSKRTTVLVTMVVALAALAFTAYLRLSSLAGAAGAVALVRNLKGHGNWIYTTAFSPDGTLLASGDGEGKVKVWEVSTGREVKTLQVSKLPETRTPADELRGMLVGEVTFTADGTRLIAATGYSIEIWKVADLSEVLLLPGATYPFAITPDDRTLVSSYEGEALAVWHLGEGKQVRLLPGCEGKDRQAGAVAVTPDSTVVACGTNFGEYTVKLLDVRSGKELRSLGGGRGDTKAVLGMQFSDDGRMLAVSNADKAVIVYEVSSGRELRSYTFEPGRILYVETASISHDLRWLATEEAGGAVSLIELPANRTRVLVGHEGQTGGFSYSKSGQWFASGGADKVVKLWKLPPPDSPASGWP